MKHFNEAQPYSEAAFLFAQEKKQIPAWLSFLKQLSDIFKDPALTQMLIHSKLPQATLLEVLTDPLKEIHPEMRNFLRLLITKQRLALLPEIYILFERAHLQSQHILDVVVHFATEPTPSLIQALQDALAKKFGKAIRLQTQIDPQLLSGALISAGDCIIDGSLKGQLEMLKQTLVKQ